MTLLFHQNTLVNVSPTSYHEPVERTESRENKPDLILRLNEHFNTNKWVNLNFQDENLRQIFRAEILVNLNYQIGFAQKCHEHFFKTSSEKK